MDKLMMFEGNNVEVFELDGKVLFNPYHCGKCLDLGESAIRMAISKMSDKQVVKIKNSDVKDIDIRKLNNAGENFLTESGVYKLIFKSNKSDAEKFQDWVTDEVLPSIRKHGAYATDVTIEKICNDPDFGIQLLTKLKEEKKARIEAERTNAILMHVNKTYTSTELAKELGIPSAIKLNKQLSEMGIQFKQNGTWVLYSKYTDCGYTEIKQKALDNGKVVYDRHWTQLGRKFVMEQLGFIDFTEDSITMQDL